MADLPTLAEIVGLSDAELRLLLLRQGVRADLEDRVMVAAERAASRLIRANAPSPALVDSVMLASERAIRRELQKAAKELVRQYETREGGVTPSTLERWVSVQDDRVCEDCEARHGAVQTHQDWEADGLPGSENTICDGNCRCVLVRDDSFTGPYERGDVKVTVALEQE